MIRVLGCLEWGGVEKARDVHESTSYQLGITSDTGQGRARRGIPSRTHQGVGQQLKGSLAQAFPLTHLPSSERRRRDIHPSTHPLNPGRQCTPQIPLPHFEGPVPRAQQGSRARQA